MCSQKADAFGSENLPVLEEMYAKYIDNPNSVSASWRQFFFTLEGRQKTSKKAVFDLPAKEDSGASIERLLQSYRMYGHLLANINPLASALKKEPLELNLKALGFSEEDLEKEFPTRGLLKEPVHHLKSIIDALKAVYSRNIGFEYMGLQKPELEAWIQSRIEKPSAGFDLSIEERKRILDKLNKSELFECFLHMKYTGQKRFSIEGGETLIPMLDALVEYGSLLGIDAFVLGMAHRGRLNVLSNILNKSYADIFSEFEERYIPESVGGSGDVKYHKGFFSAAETSKQKKIDIFLCPNPSHLEAVDPVVEGQVKALQVKRRDADKEKSLAVLIHGDASIAGQGVVYETLQLYGLPGYSTGGTVHIVINNQIGFTTLPEDGRSTRYCTDIAKAFGAPVFHVNAEDPEGCVFVAKLAAEIRQRFHIDVFIDLNCYRKYGHNEGDEPGFTQPVAYELIEKKRPIREIYRDQLIEDGILDRQAAEELENAFKLALKQEHEEREENHPIVETPKEQDGESHPLLERVDTGVDKTTLLEIGEKICLVPQDFKIHPKLEKLLKERLEMIQGKRPVDWGMGELLAYASLLFEGTSVRLTGQDCCRGTFSHRHAVWISQDKETAYSPLGSFKEGQGAFDIYNSPLSEYAALGFEFGYSFAYPESLVVWEAQFGDFCNGAQVIIDQFITTSEQKWGLQDSLVMLLPHGYEGQGPEHSSGRIERFLTLAGDDNIQVINPSTPAQMFHALRRQMIGKILKPLVIFTPKSLLRHPLCTSSMQDLSSGFFQTVIDDAKASVEDVTTLVLSSGHIFYGLLEEQKKKKALTHALIRLEQYYPLDEKEILKVFERYPKAKQVIFAQEEPMNMGAWQFLEPYLKKIAGKKPLVYIGRPRFASTATGSHLLHKKQQQAILDEVFKR